MSQTLQVSLEKAKPTIQVKFTQPPEAPAELAAVAVGLAHGGGAFMVSNRLNELSGDASAQEAAQQNLGLGVADPVAYYILAKA